jgi:hypothetical protein
LDIFQENGCETGTEWGLEKVLVTWNVCCKSDSVYRFPDLSLEILMICCQYGIIYSQSGMSWEEKEGIAHRCTTLQGLTREAVPGW